MTRKLAQIRKLLDENMKLIAEIAKLLHEIDDMVLLREPRPFSLHTSRQIMRMLGRGDDRWRKYLFY